MELKTISGGYSEVDQFYFNFLSGTEAETTAPPIVVLHQNYPNPFNPVTTIRYHLFRSGPVTLDVFDVTGRPIIRLVDTDKIAGDHVAHWDGLDSGGAPVSSGVYFSVLTSREITVSRKMILTR